MKFIGQYIQSFIARFRNDIYLEDISTGTITSGGNLGLDSNNKIVKATDSAPDADASTKGIVELATTAETTTGTDATRAVTPDGLKDGYQGSSNVVTVGTITTGNWRASAIAHAYIGADAIEGDNIADNAIDSEHYTDGSIDTAHIADAQVTVAKLHADAVQTAAEIASSFGDNDTSLLTAAAVDDRIRVTSKHVLRCNSFYVNDVPLVQNSLYFGNSVGNNPWNWNDPAAVGGVIGDTSSFTIIGDDENWGIVLPMDISKIEVQCSLRPSLGQGDDFTLAVYTGVRSDDSAAALTLTKVGHQSVSLSSTNQNYTRNDLTVTGDYDKGTMIYVGVGSEDATDAKNARGYMNITVTER